MRRFVVLFVVGLSVFLVVACNRTQPPAASSFHATATIKDIMDAVVDPAADTIWESVATVVSAAGTEERRPRTDEDWKKVHNNAVMLVEAGNLLLVEGRQVALPGHKSEFPGIELEPDQVDKLIKDDWAAWTKLAQALHDAAVPALRATEAKNADALLDAGEAIDVACENCHMKYWYPPNAAQIPPSMKKE